MEPSKVTVHVSVTDGSDPVGYANVTLKDAEENEYSGRTGSAGGCNIQNVPVGNYAVNVTKEGYDEYGSNVEITEESHSITITLEKS